jgi:hypothetical protein
VSYYSLYLEDLNKTDIQTLIFTLRKTKMHCKNGKISSLLTRELPLQGFFKYLCKQCIIPESQPRQIRPKQIPYQYNRQNRRSQTPQGKLHQVFSIREFIPSKLFFYKPQVNYNQLIWVTPRKIQIQAHPKQRYFLPMQNWSLAWGCDLGAYR